MLDSVRVRLTVWYSAVLAVVLILVCVTTYVIVQKTSMQRTDGDLAVLADSFLVTFQAELQDAITTQDSPVFVAAHQSMIEHRSDSDTFVVLGLSGEAVANSNDGLALSARAESSIARVLASDDYQRFAKMGVNKEVGLETIRGEHSRFRAYSRQFKAKGTGYRLSQQPPAIGCSLQVIRG